MRLKRYSINDSESGTVEMVGVPMKLESEVQSEIMIEAAKHGIMLWRNNSGGFKDETGRMVFYGLGVISKKQNERIKSSDLIGIMNEHLKDDPQNPYIRYRHSGVFIAIECKREGWVFNPKDKREQAQKAFIDFVISKGGVAAFCSSVGDFLKVIGKA